MAALKPGQLEHRRGIDPASFGTDNGRRDSNVRSARLLDADRYPVITFRSEGVKVRCVRSGPRDPQPE
jgi:polyisoprenoid-binding protein YceI